ncbi:sterol desaturase family protein [Gordonia sp. HY002]|uniref:sterol desaturase family protein n=1 Tax=Gordonia zhenghanii TaxID=2911516 RepID=UPI001EF08DA8|nr:sterol desaturase family protein [Gordonia zhenghanii]MCF8571721.1 sterol desaturase family protein [Gordonia zhenghanii]MCF8602745.1 sterol desaturase family protein [Gordonia zhenghanii]
MLDAIPEQLREPTLFAIPFFVLMLGLELFAAARLEHSHDDQGRPVSGAYKKEDARASILMGLVSIGTSAVGKFLALFVYAALFAYAAPWQLPIGAWYTWVIGFVGIDFLFYWEHRIAHRVRVVWATHQAHHSSEYYNFATALRQKWNPSMSLIMWLPLPALGVPPAVVFASYSFNLIYQFWVHTEHIGTMWRPFEFLMNTPSHHRVHHGRDAEYLDRNYAGVFIVWDRMFGSFQREIHRPTYGLTSSVGTYNLWQLQTHEYAAVIRDVRSASTFRTKLGYVFGPPGWAPRTAEREPADSPTLLR